MNPAVREAADALERRTKACRGYRANTARLKEKGEVPEWYAELLSTTPLCGLRLGWQPTDNPAGEIAWIQIADEWGLARIPGYVIFGHGAQSTGDRYAFPVEGDKDDPPVLRLAPGAMIGEPVAARLSDLLRWAPVLVWDEESD